MNRVTVLLAEGFCASHLSHSARLACCACLPCPLGCCDTAQTSVLLYYSANQHEGPRIRPALDGIGIGVGGLYMYSGQTEPYADVDSYRDMVVPHADGSHPTDSVGHVTDRACGAQSPAHHVYKRKRDIEAETESW
ncbi:hypothetical protein K458DRAFT_419327 [Lentithecium fluviatile CBS 122367]|uniref:Uncharacterized protein n=1 Tax=Lentithecium fluviatile CBS 122367 TaxID=1168545 RepID=A0A6G1IXX5_9PLEO|nr:hypothetical protein K458DRAFT_419327 [Lentithecium fluviatile CBS 122367]